MIQLVLLELWNLDYSCNPDLNPNPEPFKKLALDLVKNITDLNLFSLPKTYALDFSNILLECNSTEYIIVGRIIIILRGHVLFINSSIYPFIHPSIHPYLYPSIPPYLYPSIHPYLYPSFHLSIHTSIYQRKTEVYSCNQCCGSGSGRVRIIWPYPDPHRDGENGTG